VTRGLYWQLAGFYFFYFGYLGAFAPYFSLYLDSLGYAAAVIGTLMALPQMMRIFAPHLWGYLADRTARRVRVACLAGAAGTLCYAGVFAGSSPRFCLHRTVVLLLGAAAAHGTTCWITLATARRLWRIRQGSIGFCAVSAWAGCWTAVP
jgi:hypothetical protein